MRALRRCSAGACQPHGILERRRQKDVADLHGQDRDAPLRGLVLKSPLDVYVQLLAPYGHLSSGKLPNGVPQGCLGRQLHSARKVAYLGTGGLRIVDHPQKHGVHVQWNQISSKGLFCLYVGCPHAAIDAHRVLLDEGHGPEQAWPRHPVELAQAQHHHALPLLSDVHRHGRKHRRYEGDDGNRQVECARNENAQPSEQEQHDGEHERAQQNDPCARGPFARRRLDTRRAVGSEPVPPGGSPAFLPRCVVDVFLEVANRHVTPLWCSRSNDYRPPSRSRSFPGMRYGIDSIMVSIFAREATTPPCLPVGNAHALEGMQVLVDDCLQIAIAFRLENTPEADPPRTRPCRGWTSSSRRNAGSDRPCSRC